MTNKKRTLLAVAELVVGGLGLALVIHAAGWEVGIGIFLMLWGNNLKPKL